APGQPRSEVRPQGHEKVRGCNMRKLFLFAPLAAILLLPCDGVSQRGGRDGRRGEGGGRGDRAGPSTPTPSFSRPSDAPPNQTPTTLPGLIPVSRPNRPPGGGNRPEIGGGNRPGRPDRPGTGGGNQPPIDGGNRPGRPDRPG